MKMPHRTRLAVAVLALGGLGLGSVAQADPFVGRLIGSVAAGMLVNGAIKSHDKKFATQCRLYDREGMEVYLPCDSRRPLGEVLTQDKPDAMADGLAGGPPVDVAPLAAPPAPHHAAAPFDEGAAAYAAANGLPMNARPGECFAQAQTQWARRPCDDVVHAAPAPVYAPAPPVVHYAPPPVRHAPMPEADCGCEHGFRDQRARPVASVLSAQGGHARTSYGAGRVLGVYDAYEESSSSNAVSYSESYSHGGYGGGYGYGFTGGVGGSGGFYPYGGVGYGAGGYADGPARVAGRDAAGFLTWPGKRVR